MLKLKGAPTLIKRLKTEDPNSRTKEAENGGPQLQNKRGKNF